MRCPKCKSSESIVVTENVERWRELYEVEGEIQVKDEEFTIPVDIHGLPSRMLIHIKCMECDIIVHGDAAYKAFGFEDWEDGGTDMTTKVDVTEKLRKEIRDRISELTPDYSWHVIAREERAEVDWAFLRIDKEGRAEYYADAAVTLMIKERSMGAQHRAEQNLEWLRANNLYMGAKFRTAEEVQAL